MKVRLFIIFTFGMILGCIATNLYIGIRERTATITCIGKVQLDTASYEDNRLNNAIFIDNPEATNGRIYLRFSDNKIMNNTIGKQVQVSGNLKYVILEKGQFITELTVMNFEQINKNLQIAKQFPCSKL